MEQSHFADAAAPFSKAVAHAPESFEAHLQLARALPVQAPPNLISCGDTGWQVDHAGNETGKALALSPNDSSALALMGDVAFRKGSYKRDMSQREALLQESTAFYRKALTANSRNVDAHAGIAQTVMFGLSPKMNIALTNAHRSH